MGSKSGKTRKRDETPSAQLLLAIARVMLEREPGGATLRRATELLARSLDCEFVCVFRLTGNDQRPRIAASAGSMRNLKRFILGPKVQASLQMTMRREGPSLLPDFGKADAAAGQSKAGRAMLAPIVDAGRSLGVMALRSRANAPFTLAQCRLVASITGMIALNLKRTQREQQRRLRTRRYQRLLEESGGIIFRARVVPDFAIDYVSPVIEELTGYRPVELYRNPGLIEQLIHPDDLPSVRSDLAHPHALKQRVQLRLISRDGRRIWVSILRVPIVERDGPPVAYQGVVYEIDEEVAETERLRAVAEAQMAILLGKRFRAALVPIVRHLRQALDADEVVVATEDGEADALAMIAFDSRRGRNTMARSSVRRTDPLVRRALHADRAVVLGRSIGTLLPWGDDRLGLLLVRLPSGDAAQMTRTAATIDRFGHHVAALANTMRSFRRQLRKSVEEDRSRIARELHDGVVQSLFAVAMQLQLEAERTSEPIRARLSRATSGIREAIQDIHQYVFDLEPSLLLLRGLEGSLQQLIADFQATAGIEGQLNADPDAVATLQGAAPHVLQVVREALSNVRRHSNARHVRVTVNQRDNGVAVLEIRDDGRGFNPDVVQGMGLNNLRNRARQLGGTLELRSERGGGSIVRVTVPAVGGVAPASADVLPLRPSDHSGAPATVVGADSVD